MFTCTDTDIVTRVNCNDYVSAVSNLSVLMSKFDVTRPSNFHKVLKTSVSRVFEFTHRSSAVFNFNPVTVIMCRARWLCGL